MPAAEPAIAANSLKTFRAIITSIRKRGICARQRDTIPRRNQPGCFLTTTRTILLAIVTSVSAPGIAFAYVGPGAGIGLIGSLLGLIVAILLAVGIILIWPIRRMLRSRRAQANQDNAEAEPHKPNTEQRKQDSDTEQAEQA